MKSSPSRRRADSDVVGSTVLISCKTIFGDNFEDCEDSGDCVVIFTANDREEKVVLNNCTISM
jgi:hypothetical protein